MSEQTRKDIVTIITSIIVSVIMVLFVKVIIIGL